MIYGLLGLLFADCADEDPPTDTQRPDTAGCPDYQGPTYLGVEPENCAWPDYWAPASAVNHYCDPTVHAFDVYTVGWTGGGEVTLLDTGGDSGRQEHHPLASYDWDPDGWWDNLYAELLVVDPADVVEGESTAFPCEITPTTTFVLTVFDPDGAEVDCAAWGDAPDVAPETCVNWN